jgi:hypothetical protein
MTDMDTWDLAEAGGSVFDPATGLDFHGLTLDEEARILQAHAVIFATCQAAAARELAGQRPRTARELADAEAALQDARMRLEGPQAVADQLAARLDECVRKGEECKLASEDDDLETCITARSRKIAYEQTAEELGKRVQVAQRIADPLHVAVIDAERKLKTARMHAETLERAIELPFATGLGMATGPYARYLRATGEWLGENSPEAEKIARAHLEESGYGRRLQEDAINAYLDGDPAARQIGHTKTWPDGTSMIHRDGQPPVVFQGRVTAQDLAHGPVVNPVPGPPGADVIGGLRNAAGWPQ